MTGLKERKWIDAMKAKGHSPVLDADGRIDWFYYEVGHHNGPGCSICGWSCCWDCIEPEEIPECDVIDLTAAPASIGNT